MFDAAASATASEVASEQVAQEQAEAAVSGEASHDSTGGEKGGGEDVVQALTTYMPSDWYSEICLDDATVANDQGMGEGHVGVTEANLTLSDSEQMNWAGLLGSDYFSEGSFIESLGTGVDGSADTSDQATGESSEGATVEIAADPVTQAPTGSSQGLAGSENGEGEEGLQAVTTDVPSEKSAEVAFVDPTVSNYQELLGNMDPNIEVIILDGKQDGVEQMAAVLSGRTGISAIHLISHGNDGVLQLGTGTLTTDGISGQYADELATIQHALSEHADILVYGCEVAVSEQGQAFVTALAAATGADVAASDDLTGNADLDGDWVLEHRVGTVETAVLTFDAYRGVLGLDHTGEWAVTGTTASGTSTASASTTVGGVTTTVSFSNFSNSTTTVSNFATSGTGATLNDIGAFSHTVQNTASVGIQFNWDNTPEYAINLAATDAGTARMTITFSQALKDPIIHLDRIGGAGGIQNGMQLTLVDDGVSLTRLAGTSHFRVSGNVIDNSQAGVANSVGSGFGAESSTNTTGGTSAGSVQINGTVTSVTFLLATSANANATEGLGGDGFELKLTLDAPPDAKGDTFTVNEDATLNGNLFASNGAGADSDSTGDAFTVTKINGASFTVGTPITLATGTLTVTNAVTGAFTFEPNANYNGPASFTYTIADANGGTDNATVNIAVNAVNDAPSDLSLSASTVAENATTGTVVGTVTGTDVDAGDTKTYSLTDTAGGRFAINASTGVITVADGSLLNYETAASHNLTVQVTDSGGQSYTEQFTINLTNVNEGPTDLSLSASTVAEHATTGTVVGIVTGTDVDTGDTKTYSLTDTAGGRFAINASTGVLTVADGSLLNYEAAASHNLTVRVTDSGGQSYTESFTITLTNVNEALADTESTDALIENMAHTLATTTFGPHDTYRAPETSASDQPVANGLEESGFPLTITLQNIRKFTTEAPPTEITLTAERTHLSVASEEPIGNGVNSKDPQQSSTQNEKHGSDIPADHTEVHSSATAEAERKAFLEPDDAIDQVENAYTSTTLKQTATMILASAVFQNGLGNNTKLRKLISRPADASNVSPETTTQ